jgi:hypothetical protein
VQFVSFTSAFPRRVFGKRDRRVKGPRADRDFWVAHVSRVLVSASRRNQLFLRAALAVKCTAQSKVRQHAKRVRYLRRAWSRDDSGLLRRRLCAAGSLFAARPETTHRCGAALRAGTQNSYCEQPGVSIPLLKLSSVAASLTIC